MATFLPGPAGRLEMLYRLPDPGVDAPAGRPAAALVCHPHPDHGGTMHTKVVYHLARGLRAAGLPTLRFNYRGVGLSDPGPRADDADGERLEREDIRAAVRWLSERHPGQPLLLAGFSFGARYGLEVGLEEGAVAECLAVGLAVRLLAADRLRGGAKPTTFLHGDHDALGPLDDVRALAATWRGPAHVEVVRGADHFFEGHLDAVEDVARRCGAGPFPERAAS